MPREAVSEPVNCQVVKQKGTWVSLPFPADKSLPVSLSGWKRGDRRSLVPRGKVSRGTGTGQDRQQRCLGWEGAVLQAA